MYKCRYCNEECNSFECQCENDSTIWNPSERNGRQEQISE